MLDIIATVVTHKQWIWTQIKYHPCIISALVTPTYVTFNDIKLTYFIYDRSHPLTYFQFITENREASSFKRFVQRLKVLR